MILAPIKLYFTVAQVEFTSHYGDEYRCEIQRDAIFGEPESVKHFTAGGEPLTIAMLNEGDPTTAVIKGSEAVLNIHNFQNFETLNLLKAGNRSYRLLVYRNNNLIWTGFMVPENYSEPFIDTPYPATLTFIDGIGLLRNEDFVDANGCYFVGYAKDRDIIGYLISKIGLARNFTDGINICDESTYDTSTGTFDEKIKDLEAFRDMTCYDVLYWILKSYVARVEFYTNQYHFSRCDDSEDTRRISQYQRMGNFYDLVFQGTINVKEATTTAKAADTDRVVWLYNDAQLERLPGWKKIKFTQDYGTKQTMLTRGLFSDCDFQPNGELRAPWFAPLGPGSAVKGVIEEQTCLKLIGTRGFANCAMQPIFMPGGNTGLFEVELTVRNGNFQPFPTERTYGAVPGRPSLMNVWSKNYIFGPAVPIIMAVNVVKRLFGRRPKAVDQTEQIPQTLPATIVNSGGRFMFQIQKSDVPKSYLDEGFALPTNSRVVFRDPKNTPLPFAAGVVYRLLVEEPLNPLTGIGRFRFSLYSDVTGLITQPNPASVDKPIPVGVRFSYMPCKFWLAGVDGFNRQLSQRGSFTASDVAIDIELPDRSLDSKEFFTVKQIARLPYTFPQGARLNFQIGNVRRNNTPAAQEGVESFIESVKVRLIDTPEFLEDETTLSSDNNQDGQVDVMFADAPYPGPFTNKQYIYFNNFYSKTTDTEPELQKAGANNIAYKIADYVRFVYRKFYTGPRILLRGSLESPEKMLFGKILTEPYTGRKYLMGAGRYNAKMHIFEGEWHEIDEADAPAIRGSYSNQSYSNDYDQ